MCAGDESSRNDSSRKKGRVTIDREEIGYAFKKGKSGKKTKT